MAEPIRGEWLSAADLAIESQPPGSSPAQLARAVLEAVVPLVRAERPEGVSVEWGVSFADADRIPWGPVVRYYDEGDARLAKRDVEALDPARHGTVVSRQVWTEPWNEVPGA